MKTQSCKEQQRTSTTWTQQWCTRLRRAGYRLTPARQAIVTTIADINGPFNAPQILDCAQAKQPQLGLATVYRTLDTLEALGLIQRLHDDAGCHNYLGVGEEVPPIVRCASCGRLDFLEGISLQVLLDTIVGHCDYQIDRYSLQMSGTCGECQ